MKELALALFAALFAAACMWWYDHYLDYF